MKKFLLLTMCMLLTHSVLAYDLKFNGVYYNLDHVNKTATVTYGSTSYNSYSGTVDVPDYITTDKGEDYDVVAIGDNAFRNSTGMTSVTIATGIKTIGNYAFYGCSKLTAVKIPNSVVSLGTDCFRGCSKIVEVTLSPNLTAISDRCFYGCSSLKSIVFPKDITSIGDEAFRDCSLLADVSFSTVLVSIGNGAFRNCTSLPNMRMPLSLRSIGDYALYGCTKLENVTLNDELLTMGNYAMANCSALTEMTLPAKVTIGTYLFDNCPNLKRLIFAEGMTRIQRTWATAVTHIVLPNSTKTIDNEAFRNSTYLPAVFLPANIESIGTDAFAGCTNLQDLEYAEGTKTALRTYATSLTKVTIPSTCVALADNIFAGCTNLSNIHISNLEMWNYIFLNQKSNPFECGHFMYLNGQLLSELTADFGAPIGNYAFSYTKGLKKVTLTGSITDIQAYAFANSTDLQNVVMGNGVKTVGASAFLGCNSLENARIGKSVTEIKDYAFYACTTLKSVRMGGNEKTIGEGAFKGCTRLPSIILPATVTSIGASAFEDCKELCSINLPEGLTVINSNTFAGCLLLPEITFPSSVVTIGSKAFYNCPALEIIDLPDAVETIGADAFNQCKGINFVTVGTGIKIIESGAFSNCVMLKAFYCLALDVPSTNSNSFSGSDPASITLYVPDESTAAYRTKTPWSSFATSLGLSAAPVYANDIFLSPEVFIVSDNPDDENYIRATVTPDNATNAKVTWMSSNTSVATVSRTGLVSPIMEGVATITCTAADKHGARAKALVIVANKFQPVTSISLDKTEMTLTEGDFYQLIPTTLPTAATYDVITWTSSDDNIATVSEAGIVTAMNAGNVDIVATTSDGTKISAVCKLTVEVPATSALSTIKDANGDGFINADDITVIKNHILGRDTSHGNDCDVNGDGNVSIADVNAVIAAMNGEGNIVSGPLKVIGFSAPSYTMVVGDSRTITPVLVPYRAGSHIDWSVSDTNIVTLNVNQNGACVLTALAPGQVVLTATANDGTGLQQEVTISIEPNHYGVADGHKWADLGLPSGTLWATDNIGATTSEGYGSYFAWGEVSEKGIYDWSTYALCNGSSTTLKKYCTASSTGTRDDKTVLETSDDVASSVWGANWTMPTNDQLKELFNAEYAITEWTMQSGVLGRKVTSKKNGCSIFLPAAGYKNESGISSVGNGGYYASKNLADPSTKAYGLNFGTSTVTTDNTSFRCYGLSVRPVLSSQGSKNIFAVKLVAGESMSLLDKVSGNATVNSNLIWTCTDTNVVSVTTEGVVNALSVGTANVYATDASMMTTTFQITVNPIEVAITNRVLKVGSKARVSANTSFPITWSSSNPSVATVDADGVVTALSCGQAAIVCNSVNGASQSTNIIVPENTLDCIGNTADAKIYLDYVFKTNTRIEIKLAFIKNNGTSILGEQERTENNEIRFFMSSNAIYFDLVAGRITKSSLSDYRSPHVYEIGNYYIKRDGSQLTSSTVKTFTRTQSLCLFPDEDCANVYYVKIFEGDKLIREYVPIVSEHVPCFYETQEGKLYKAQNPQNIVDTFYDGLNGHEYVDLGLPSGLKWATCNVGANTPEDYGDYYAWGETEPKLTYSWSTYFDSTDGKSFTKYGYDRKTVLDSEDDVAQVKWGGCWRMPTYEEQEELRKNCTWIWTDMNDVYGIQVIGPNGNTMFLPATGTFNDGEDLSGAYWPSSLVNTSHSSLVSYLYFNSRYFSGGTCSRSFGRSVRAVCP